MELTGAVAKAVMVWWDKQFCLKAGSLGILLQLYKRYVEDENVLVDELTPGSRYEDGVLVVKPEEVERDMEKPADQTTMEVVKDVANSIEGMIQTKADFPSKHEDNKMPLLDTKIYVEEKDDESREIQFEFYKKKQCHVDM